ncbi:hypothetical protein FKR81_37390 [Lentzea tibetensis]|uniref:Uncharacterized protein n=1 Tax=Lentzea tibetensis TaxID=2591470 RepID=A0A563EHM0_9PSEU|nr:hypothetical protein [Lentzea tibetensis]TWP46049.1 hypothetical protein FKR81_37390 [Lentzea tibetensis]
MATTEEIERRVEDADSARSARRSAAAKQVGELALRRTAIAEQLADIERDLGDVLAESSDVMEIEELAEFTDLPVADLTRWRDTRKTNHTKKKLRAARSVGARDDTSRGQSTPRPPTSGRAPGPPAVPRVEVVTAPERVAADVS